MDVIAPPKQLVRAGLPRQKGLDTQHGDRLELEQLATELSIRVTREQQVREQHANDILPFTAGHSRPHSLVRRVVFIWLPIALVVAALAVTVLSFRTHPPVPAAPPAAHVPSQPATPAQALGQAAGQRLGQGGRPVDVFVCQGAYVADATAQPQVLPPADTVSPAHDAYIQACMSDMSAQ